MASLESTLSSTGEASSVEEAFILLKAIILGDENQMIEDGTIQAYCSIKQGVILTLGALGSFACGIWSEDEHILVSVAGTPTQATFYSFARGRLRNAIGSDVVIEKSNPGDYDMFRVKVKDVTFNITYHQASQNHIHQLWNSTQIPEGVTPVTKRNFEDRAKSMQLASIFKGKEQNVACYQHLKEWAKNHGLYSVAFNLLTSDSVIDITAITLGILQSSRGDDWNLEDFFSELSTLYDTNDKVSLQHPHSALIKAPKLDNTTIGGSIILEGLAIREKGGSYIESFTRFCSSYPQYLQVDLSYWGLSRLKGARYVHAVESVLSGYLKRLDIRLFPKLKLRPWPDRLVAGNLQTGVSSGDAAYYEAAYLVGVSYTSEVPEEVISSLPTLLRDEVTRNKYYDSKMAFIDVAWASKVDSGSLVPDQTIWGALPEEKKPGSRDDDDDNFEEVTASDTPIHQAKIPAGPPAGSSGWHKADESAGSGRTPLRPALDVLHRVKNDHSIDSSDYVIGYLDRHSGIKEMPADLWIMKEETAEDFIPQSRIRYFKRLSDRVVVWDRESRLDILFGSGRRV